MQAISSRLKQARMSNGFKSSSEFARYAGVETGTYRHHENGSRGLTVHALTKYADILDVCVCWLLTGQGNSSDKNNEHKSKSGNGHNGEDKIAFITAEFLSLNAKDKRDTLKVLVRFAHK